MQHQDWEPVVWSKKKPLAKDTPKYQNPAGTSQFKKLDSDDPPPPQSINMNIAKQIQQARMAKNLNQKQLAVLINVQSCVINAYESGKENPPKPILQKISKALGVKFV